MAKGSVNKVILIGRMGNDPEMRFMPNGNERAARFILKASFALMNTKKTASSAMRLRSLQMK